MNGVLTLGAALLLGLAASGHCLVMCGGISAALGIATEKGTDGRPRPRLRACTDRRFGFGGECNRCGDAGQRIERCPVPSAADDANRGAEGSGGQPWHFP